ncbi:hypothetical protein N309_07082, partial [Tinamus guttatus]
LRPVTASFAWLENLLLASSGPGKPGPVAGGLPVASSTCSCRSPDERPRASTCRAKRSSCARRRQFSSCSSETVRASGLARRSTSSTC